MTRYNLINILILLSFLMMGATVTPMAQQYIGSYNQPNVVVNDSVIESLAPRPNIAKRHLQIRGIGDVTNTTGQTPPSISSIITSNTPSSNSKRVGLIPPGPKKPSRYKSKKIISTKTKLPTAHQTKKSLVKTKLIKESKPARKSPTLLGNLVPPSPPKIIDPIKKVIIYTSETNKTEPPLGNLVPPSPPKIIDPIKKVIINTSETKKTEPPISSAIIPPSPVVTNRQEGLAASSAKTIKPLEKKEAVVSALPSKQEHIKTSLKSTIKFMADSGSLDSSAMNKLSNLLKVLKDNKSYTVQLSSYARSGDGSAIQARRISLSRALAIRSHFIKNGISRTRIEVKALGNKFENEFPNRIDIVVRNR